MGVDWRTGAAAWQLAVVRHGVCPVIGEAKARHRAINGLGGAPERLDVTYLRVKEGIPVASCEATGIPPG